jgi:hypothetical protein
MNFPATIIAGQTEVSLNGAFPVGFCTAQVNFLRNFQDFQWTAPSAAASSAPSEEENYLLFALCSSN